MKKENLEKNNKKEKYILKTKTYEKKAEAVKILEEIQKNRISAYIEIQNNKYRITTKKAYEKENAEEIKDKMKNIGIEMEDIFLQNT